MEEPIVVEEGESVQQIRCSGCLGAGAVVGAAGGGSCS